jgi:isopropylmalate/homocitrate/citramalate synthase
METIRLKISDETLRDGEQQVGLFFDELTKQALASLIAQTGVHQIAVMPAIHATEERLVRTLVAKGLRSQVTASTLMEPKFIDQSKACGVERVILFYAISDRLLFLRDPESRHHLDYRLRTHEDHLPVALRDRIRHNMIQKVLKNLQYAQKIGLKIDFAAEDASRADFDFLVECIRKFRPYLEHFLLCDTVGLLTPDKTQYWIHNLLDLTHQAPLAVHFHNDMGLALENTIQAVLAGASGISGTFGGIGERAGNVALDQVLNGLRLRCGLQVDGIHYETLSHVTNYLQQQGIWAHPPYSREAQRHEAGIHVNSVLHDRYSYSVFSHGEPEIWFGKCSGASNFQYLFEVLLQRPLTPIHYERLRCQVKALSILEKRSFSTQEVLELLQRKILKIEEDV